MKKLAIVLAALISTTAAARGYHRNPFDRVKQYDFDGDGKVSFEDINRYCTVSKKLFDRADKNGDGYLSNPELRAAKEYLLDRCGDMPK